MSNKEKRTDRILVAYDGSSNAEGALRQAVPLAASSNGTIHVIRAIESTFGMSSAMAPELTPLMQIQLQRHTEDALHAAVDGRLPKENLSVEIIIGDIVEGVMHSANTRKPTLVVVGSHGDIVPSTGATLGHVASGLLERCACSVLVARPTFQVADSKDFASTPEPPCTHCIEAQRRLGTIDALCAAHEQQALPYDSPFKTAPTAGIEQQRQDAWILS